MIWSEAQRKDHEEAHERNRQALVKGRHKVTPKDRIVHNRNRAVSLVKKIQDFPETNKSYAHVWAELTGLKSYNQDTSHFTLDCHRYGEVDLISGKIGDFTAEAQVNMFLSPEEFKIYDRVLREEIGKEPAYDIEIKGIGVGADGLVAQVWYHDEKMTNFILGLRDRVRSEVPTMDFKWSVVEREVPVRVVNLTRFTGEEDPKKVLEYVDEGRNRGREFGISRMNYIDLIFSDYYVQDRNTFELSAYVFS